MATTIRNKLIVLIKEAGKIKGEHNHPIDFKARLSEEGIDSLSAMELFLGIEREWGVDCFEMEDKYSLKGMQEYCVGMNRIRIRDVYRYIQKRIKRPQNRPSTGLYRVQYPQQA